MILNGNIYQQMLKKTANCEKQIAVLIDPDNVDNDTLVKRVEIINTRKVNYIFVGGSLLKNSIENCVDIIKDNTTKPVILFPGNSSQISDKADAILFLSLISGRNPEFLIGNHVIAAPFLYQTGLEIISTAYILIDGGKVSSVQYMSNTNPIPSDKTDITVATALAGEMCGNKLIYLEAGSGALSPVADETIFAVKQKISCPLIVGGGIKTKSELSNKFNAGADIVVIGNAIERNEDLLKSL
ncbi:MAG TPA: geranylgeranylglyceryl/heptaprenylglyceryl phosphate synthase [Bacteroidales bacterium]|nr:geranylgeranylglyceryl/heptaprenylglyceryl phosphate synthase [Bacteroidales bacterium]